MILVTGAAGFVGRNLVRELLAGGRKVRCLVRDVKRAAHLEAAGCELARGDILDQESLEKAFSPRIRTVIHLAGIILEVKGSSFRAVHVQGTANVLSACLSRGVGRYLHISALGARAGARSEYHRTKWEAEGLVRASGLDSTVFRPSIIFGKEDAFTNMFARALKHSPLIAVPGSGRNLIQPVFVGDLVKAMARSIDDPAAFKKVFEVGGPERLTLDEIIDRIASVMGRRVLKIHLPMPVMRSIALFAEKIFKRPPITRDQLTMLEEDNVTEEDALKDAFGITPTGLTEGMREYLS